MRPLINQFNTAYTPESLVEQLQGEPGVVLLRSGLFDSLRARYSFVAARPFLTFRSFGSRCEITQPQDSKPALRNEVAFGNPWHVLDALLARYELIDQADQSLPLGGCFGYWGYDLKKFVEPKLRVHSLNDLELPDCHLGFYDSLVAFDHQLGKTLIIATGLGADGSRDVERQGNQIDFWQARLSTEPAERGTRNVERGTAHPERGIRNPKSETNSTFTREAFIAAVESAQRYIHSGDIYQVNLTQRLSAGWDEGGWSLFRKLADISPAPFAAFVDCADFQLASSSPELFLRLSGSHIQTRPIKGTRPRSRDASNDARLAYELQTSAKEQAELVMITDLLRNDLGRVCEFGSVQVPDLLRLEKFAQVQHLVSTIEGRLRPDVTHLAALASCFPGGSITGAPKFRAMEIIDELEPVSRGPYCGALGYLGFNRESQLSIIIRTAICKDDVAHFPVGAGIVADSDPAAEYEETLAKARGFLTVLEVADSRGWILNAGLDFSPPSSLRQSASGDEFT
jgi:para-aminobenzoate synthetase component 1